MGNLRSVQRAFEHLGVPVRVQSELDSVEKLVIPGVGAFGAAMERLAPLASEIRSLAESGAPILGICLGQQLLMESSEELGAHRGLGLLAGRARYFPPNMALKVPHVGWSELFPRRAQALFADLRPHDQVYFVHSLYTEVEDAADVAAEAEYGIRFPAAVHRGNVWGVQFHPEKSGVVGLSILRRFAGC